MKMFKYAAAAVMCANLLIVSTGAFSSEASDAQKFVTMCDTNKDGMVSKEEFMKHAEKMWAKMDPKKVGKMDAKQLEAFLKELMNSGA